MLKIDIITLFPELIRAHLGFLPFKKAISMGLLKVDITNLRDFAIDSRGTVDDKPFGGGTGMLLMVEPIFKALAKVIEQAPDIPNKRVILLNPRGKKYNQKMAEDFSKSQHLIFICGRYEGVDARVEKYLATDNVSIGDYVLSGGETPTLAILESVTRLIPGVLEKEDATVKESFSNGKLEHPQYTRPAEFNGWVVPNILLGGNHQEIKRWQEENSEKTS
ncbi:tRNA (guanosine(37)-N1)-methyltransferase TrmD [candidate division WWE3 bacterium RIFOXYC1_FULL_40_10]|uniref:tRNA (guanine-N(1)-)-methyltransferase n=1 Tax=candidate division WWE3 bacterium RIFOXYA2_FULL_46_9 TaxID=1802636 RepID=A0A1F4W2C3_UNCKA|nr:MAG: tRNA (guanosine(37)-N1)-methyltransferase TrmD [candidate division WWE3 bacterium RIFOXYB1_FULL_40_22]OGC61506.1 MAG: tRNA (guanosine(37)-N1)-methyltransferase TrmD [candidate division WWE3 bacterium RIFOXYA1_FULL_40_11]OGC63438.1 MAG: tRNA (guanosine(37)-N1)-methyltransferase TrmD [candidate division WWE3 bacterium RIFOXYA2_FULL_46_9]OGC64814.1 MAG: tRNA (guanosine(37)-N1)-methyltransferase TrmD [candidate division WWE3 bacterium RIFOXYB2_FULL_41_6]OGC65889.1 MAG: tRNA (guanosine(37)-N